jgi:hypothetical protein
MSLDISKIMQCRDECLLQGLEGREIPDVCANAKDIASSLRACNERPSHRPAE